MYINVFKPLLDKILALLLLILASPILIFTAIAIMIKMGTPILFRQERPGKKSHIFSIYKFRSMSDEKDNLGNLLPDEDRLKGLGQFIRSNSLDELPQLINVLKGEMSFIGPRPLLVEYLPLYSVIQKKRHNVTPGISGWAQINGRNAISWEEKFKLDVYYVEHISFALDIKIILLTIKKVLFKENISSTTHITMEKFNGAN